MTKDQPTAGAALKHIDQDLVDRIMGHDWSGAKSTMFRLTKEQADKLAEALRTPASGAVEAATLNLWALLTEDHLRGDQPIPGLGLVSWDDLRSILAALTSSPKAEGEAVAWAAVSHPETGMGVMVETRKHVAVSYGDDIYKGKYDLRPLVFGDAAPQPPQGGEDDSPEKALDDARDVGIGVLVDGKRIAPDRLTICHGERSLQGGEVTRRELTMSERCERIFAPNWKDPRDAEAALISPARPSLGESEAERPAEAGQAPSVDATPQAEQQSETSTPNHSGHLTEADIDGHLP